jgi:hypothetical protein
MSLQEKILITGTGRCGTTFLMILFTFLDLDTGYNRNNYFTELDILSTSGMEKFVSCPPKYIKNPVYLSNIEDTLKYIKIKFSIIPIRDYNKSAESREKLGYGRGGLIASKNKEEQLEVFYKMISKYMYDMVKYDIPTIFLDFDRMVTSSQYLYNKLKPIMDEENIHYEMFDRVFQEVTFVQHRNKRLSDLKMNTNKIDAKK